MDEYHILNSQINRSKFNLWAISLDKIHREQHLKQHVRNEIPIFHLKEIMVGDMLTFNQTFDPSYIHSNTFFGILRRILHFCSCALKQRENNCKMRLWELLALDDLPSKQNFLIRNEKKSSTNSTRYKGLWSARF